MTQDRARKAAVRARMAETGESYTEAARQLAKPVTVQAILDTVAARLGIPDDALSVVMRHLRETREYPLLAAGAGSRLKVYLDLKDWVSLAKARLGPPALPPAVADEIESAGPRAGTRLPEPDPRAVAGWFPGAGGGRRRHRL
jgi:hypothetical protein